MLLEVLPNELLLKLFEFLDTAELFHAFHKLNNRFDTLLLTHFRPYYVNFHSTLKYKFDFLSQHYLPLIIDKIISIRLSDNNDETPRQTDFFFSSGLQLNQFIHLRSLSLFYIHNEQTLCKIIDDCHQLPDLAHLKIIKCNSAYMSSVDFSNTIWNLPKLSHCRLQIENGWFCVPTIVSSSLRYLSISCQYWGLRQTIGIFQQTPYLERLHVPLNKLNDNNHEISFSILSITILKLSDVKSSYAMMNILRAMPNLTYLKVDTYYIDFDGYQWEELIDNYLSKLKIFHFRMHITLRDKENNKQHIDRLVDSFRTQFWLEKHQWYIRCHQNFEDNSMDILLYSLPYAFVDFNLSMLVMPSRSTCLQDNDYFSYDQVNTFLRNCYLSEEYFFLIRFSNIRNISINFSCNIMFGNIFQYFIN